MSRDLDRLIDRGAAVKALLWFAASGIAVANFAAYAAGTRQGIGGMITVDALCVVLGAAAAVVWFVRRAAAPVGNLVKRASERVEVAAVDLAAQGLRAGRHFSAGAQSFAQKVRDRADSDR